MGVIILQAITAEEFQLFQRLIYEHAGISLSSGKQVMVASRLAKRVQYYELSNYKDYYHLVTHPQHKEEFQIMVNILTTNETYFFREPKHFEYLEDHILNAWKGSVFRVWSAASSTGEEAYSIAMILAERLGSRPWEIFGSDLSTRVLDAAREGVYLMDRLEYLEQKYLSKYCLRGVRSQTGMMRVVDKLKEQVKFSQINLMQNLPYDMLQYYDVIFLRNVLIYFDNETKKAVVERVIKALKPGGYFFISHSESLHRVTDQLVMVKPSIYRKT